MDREKRSMWENEKSAMVILLSLIPLSFSIGIYMKVEASSYVRLWFRCKNIRMIGTAWEMIGKAKAKDSHNNNNTHIWDICLFENVAMRGRQSQYACVWEANVCYKRGRGQGRRNHHHVRGEEEGGEETTLPIMRDILTHMFPPPSPSNRMPASLPLPEKARGRRGHEQRACVMLELPFFCLTACLLAARLSSPSVCPWMFFPVSSAQFPPYHSPAPGQR